MSDIQQEIYFRPPARILVIDDSQLNRSFIVNTFISKNYELTTAVDGQTGLEMARNDFPELILLDIMMPNMDGFEVCTYLKQDPVTKDIPVIFITALDAIQDKLRAFDVGGVDFVTKPFNHKELLARVKTNVAFHRSTQQKEKMLRIAMEEKRHETIARIAAGVTHNFNNMLGVSFGNIMLLESMVSGEIDATSQEALVDVRRSLERMQQMVRKFLILTDKASISGTYFTKVNIHSLLSDVISNIRLQNESSNKYRDFNIHNDIDESFVIECTESHVREIFHLIFNEALETSLGEVAIGVSAIEDAKNIIIKLALDRFPVSIEIQENIFEPFAMPLANVGTGLAFCVTKQLVDKNNGTVSAEFVGKDRVKFELSFPKENCPTEEA